MRRSISLAQELLSLLLIVIFLPFWILAIGALLAYARFKDLWRVTK